MSEWYKNRGTQGDIAVSTRIRLARNLKNFPFPSRMSKENLAKLNCEVEEALKDIGGELDLKILKMNDIPEQERFSMVERHIISPDFANHYADKILLLSSDESISIMVCEEDHFRIQVIKSGLDLEGAYEIADKIDDAFSKHLSFAYDDNLGYLTQCLTNIGTGLRASVMLHLPILQENGSLNVIAESAGKFGLTIRGLYGEGSKSSASLYQLSNQITLGISEKSALENLRSIAMQIIEKERTDREAINKIVLEDNVMRAYGILKNQRILSSEEMMSLLSRIKLGASMGIIDIDEALPIKILIECQPYMLQRANGIMSADDRDICRGKIVRKTLE